MMNRNDWPMLDHSVLRSEAAFDAWLLAARTDGAVALIDKEENWTSFDCVAKLRSMVGIRKVGHTGTLDPLATGLLIVCFGRATKQIDSFQEEDKVYDVVVKLGVHTETDDREGAEVSVDGHASDDEIHAALQTFIGTQQQIPPTYSAVRIQGKRQYQLARKGRPVVHVPRIVTINSIDGVSIEWPFVRFTMTCSRGTYVRSVARDLGERLGSGGMVWQLRRTRSGSVTVDDAVTMSALRQVFDVRTVS
jgi:tRNA pseudouridine55 synthase